MRRLSPPVLVHRFGLSWPEDKFRVGTCSLASGAGARARRTGRAPGPRVAGAASGNLDRARCYKSFFSSASHSS